MTLEGKRIFYIEDDSQNREIVQTILEAAGARVNFESWGFAEVIMVKMKSFRPDLILLDLTFPMGISGYDIYNIIRKNPAFATRPIAIVSGLEPTAEIPKAKALGFCGYIPKPVDFHHFPHQIEALLRGETVWG